MDVPARHDAPGPSPHQPGPSPHRALAVSRRRLLGAAGVAAGSALPWMAGAPQAAATPAAPTAETAAGTTTGTTAETAAPSPDQLPLTGGPDFPIGIFWPPHPYASTAARYAEIADAGFTFVISGNYAGDGQIFTHQLGLAQDAGLKMLISDDIQVSNMSRWFAISDDPADHLSVTPAEARELYKRAFDAYGPHSSLAGFNHYDEPGAGWFATLARTLQAARDVAPGLLPYVNLLPSTDPAYYQGFVDVVKPSLISFDRYPLLSEGREDAEYFLNWSVVRKAALSADLPAWTFIQTLAFNNHRTPTAAELLWQVNVSLAYGAKGIQYFTYWTPEAARGEGFQPALITVDGARTKRYDAARAINTTWLRPVGRELKPLVPESVMHANESPLPAGATAFTPDDQLDSVSGAPVILSTFRSRDPAVADRWVLVANRWHNARARATVAVRPTSVARIASFDPSSGEYRATNAQDALTVDLAPGAAGLYLLRAG
ncbi:hypothetical protein [Streptomyces odontomachi]|uniref:hypothetical protein n=1 Tax=Streptomyces odontomachi TaxID=2944940 RepID=UPI00210CED00|nr:hypothetical protein [Streptomyces sp. ODS25]